MTPDQRRVVSLLERAGPRTHPEMRRILEIPRARMKAALDGLLAAKQIIVIDRSAPRVFGLPAPVSPGLPPSHVPPPRSPRRPQRVEVPREEQHPEPALPREHQDEEGRSWSMPKSWSRPELRDGETRIEDYLPKRRK